MDMDDFGIMLKGFFDKRKRDELNFANVAAIIDGFAAGLAQSKTWSYKKFIAEWFGEKPPQLSKDEKKKISEEKMNRVRYTNKILAEKEKNKKSAKRVKNNN